MRFNVPLAAAIVCTVEAIDCSAALNASPSLAPAPSNKAANAVIADMICWLAFSTASASSAFTPSAYGLNDFRSTPSGRPKTRATCSVLRLPSFIKVVAGVTTEASEDAFSVTPSKTAPDEESMVLPSVMATIEKLEPLFVSE